MHTLSVGVQSSNIIHDEHPFEGFEMLGRAGFTCCDFSLNNYLPGAELYAHRRNDFFDRPLPALKAFFARHREAAKAAGIRINQMHMPYPIYVPGAPDSINEYLAKVMAPKSMEICAFFDCPYIVIHGFKPAGDSGSERESWERTEAFLKTLAPMAKALHITICLENLYVSRGNHIVEGPCCDAAKAAARIDRINEEAGAEVLGFCFDTGHANLIGLDFEDFLTTLGDRIKTLHIHDNDGIEDLHQIPFTFARNRENKASTDWNGFLAGLAGIGFDKVLSFETGPALSAFPDRMKQDALRLIAQIGEFFAGEIREKQAASGSD